MIAPGASERGMKGIYQHCGERHLHRYLARTISAAITGPGGFNDPERATLAIKDAEGKRPTYRQSDSIQFEISGRTFSPLAQKTCTVTR